MTLYAGTGQPGRVYRYDGGTTWTLVSGDLDAVVLCLCSHNGVFYAGTSTDIYGAGIGKVYRYSSGTTWTQVGGDLDNQVASLITYNGNLIAGTSRDGMKTYTLDGSNWVLRQNHGHDGTRSMAVIDGNLYEGDWFYDIIYRNGAIVLDPNVSGIWGSCIWDFAKHDGYIYAGAYAGTYFYSSNGINWTGVTIGDYSYDDNIWAVESCHNRLYLGGANLRYITSPGGSETVVMTASVLSLLNYGGVLYIGTGEEYGWYAGFGAGAVYSYTGSGTPTLISGTLDGGVQVLYTPVFGFNIWVYKSGAWQPVTDIWARKGGAWQPVSSVDVNKDGWKPI